MFGENFKIDEVKVNIFELQIEVVKQIFKNYLSREIITHLIGNDIKGVC
jgi:hypothetical protein